MDIDLIKISAAGEPGYRKPRARGTVDVWHGLHRYVFRVPREGARHVWRAAVAQLIYNRAPDAYMGTPGEPRGADLIRLESVALAGTGKSATAYRIGPLKQQGRPDRSRRKPGAPPVHGQGGLELRAIIQRGTPDWAGTSGPPRGCLLAFDGLAGPCYVYHVPGRVRGSSPADRLARAFQYSSGPRPEVRKLGTAPVYLVTARTWSPAEVSERARIRIEAAHADRRKRKQQAQPSATKLAIEARAEAVKVDHEARKVFAGIAARIDSRAGILQRATVRAATVKDATVRAEAVATAAAARVRLASLWLEYAEAVRVHGPKLRGVRGPRLPKCAPGGSMVGAGKFGGPDGRAVTWGLVDY